MIISCAWKIGIAQKNMAIIQYFTFLPKVNERVSNIRRQRILVRKKKGKLKGLDGENCVVHAAFSQ